MPIAYDRRDEIGTRPDRCVAPSASTLGGNPPSGCAALLSCVPRTGLFSDPPLTKIRSRRIPFGRDPDVGPCPARRGRGRGRSPCPAQRAGAGDRAGTRGRQQHRIGRDRRHCRNHACAGQEFGHACDQYLRPRHVDGDVAARRAGAAPGPAHAADGADLQRVAD